MAGTTVQVKLTSAGVDLAQGGTLNIQRGGGLAFSLQAGQSIEVDVAGWAFLSTHPGPAGVQLFELVPPGPVLVGGPGSAPAFPAPIASGHPGITQPEGFAPAHLDETAAASEEIHGIPTASETK